jgi:hypothetical protein
MPEPLWKMKWVGVTLAIFGGATRYWKEGKLRREVSVFPHPRLPLGFIPPVWRSQEDPGFWVDAGALGLDFWGDEYSSA